MTSEITGSFEENWMFVDRKMCDKHLTNRMLDIEIQIHIDLDLVDDDNFY